jgi:hypothetical protein
MLAERLGGSRCGARPVAAIADVRQREYVQNGRNLTGDALSQDEEGYFHFVARNDDMIISAGYNIAGPEVEAALLAHEAVSECGFAQIAAIHRASVNFLSMLSRSGPEHINAVIDEEGLDKAGFGGKLSSEWRKQSERNEGDNERQIGLWTTE